MATNSRVQRQEPELLAENSDMPLTEFSITTVNVPDRLDVREQIDRQIQDDSSKSSRIVDRYTVHVWTRRLALLAVVLLLVFFGVRIIGSAQEQMSAGELSRALTTALGRPVKVADSGLRFTPTPRLQVSGIAFEGGPTLEQASLLVDWADLWQAIRSGRWTGGEVVVGPTVLSMDQARMLMGLVPKLSAGLPLGIKLVQVSSLTLKDASLLPGNYEAVARRDAKGAFGSFVLSDLGKDGTMQLSLTPVVGSDEASFEINADNWMPPIGPRVRWSAINASGSMLPNRVEVRSYSISGFYGVLTGTMAAAMDTGWTLVGSMKGANLDVESIVAHASGRPEDKVVRGDPTLALNGTAAIDGRFEGNGATLAEALGGARLDGTVAIRWATLNGINLGYAATQPSPTGGGNGGFTRFTEFSAKVKASAEQVSFSDILARAGALTTRGEVRLAKDMKLTGGLRVDLGGSRVQAPLSVRVSGSAEKPLYGR